MSVSLPQVSNEAHVGTNLGLFFLKKKKKPPITRQIPALGLLTCAEYSAGLRGQTCLLEAQQTSWTGRLYLFNWTGG